MVKISHILLTKSLSKHTFILVKTFKLPRSPRHSIFSTLKMTKLVTFHVWICDPSNFLCSSRCMFPADWNICNQRWTRTKIAKTVLVLSHRTTHYSTYHRTSNNIMISIENIHLQGCNLSQTWIANRNGINRLPMCRARLGFFVSSKSTGNSKRKI